LFDRYTERARRAIFFARWWALQARSPKIGTGHLLLGLTHDRDSEADKLFHLCDHRDIFMQGIPGMRDFPNPPIMEGDIPLDSDSKQVLRFTADEASRLNSGPIDTEHLVLGLLRKRSLGRKLLSDAGISLSSARRLVAGSGTPVQAGWKEKLLMLSRIFLLVLLIMAIYLLADRMFFTTR
jgi:ATP-dependent Clp protease ATP-binding subunit ClpC